MDVRRDDVQKKVHRLTGGEGADIVFECVGKSETAAEALELAAPFGKICFVGNPYGDMLIPRDAYWKILRNQLELTGTWNSSFTGEESDDWHYALGRLSEGGINPGSLITHRLPPERLKEGFEIMRDKSEDYIKIMMSRHA